MPMTAEAAVQYDSGDALVAYLAQPDATATVCDSHARGPHVDHLDEDMREALVSGLVQGRIAPAKWLACTSSLLAHAPPEAAVVMLGDVGRGYRSLVRDASFEATPAMQERVAAMQKLYLERSSAIRDAHHELQPLFDDLRGAIANRRLGPIARWYGTQLLGVVDSRARQVEGQARGRARARRRHGRARRGDAAPVRASPAERRAARGGAPSRRAAARRRVALPRGEGRRDERRGPRPHSRREPDLDRAARGPEGLARPSEGAGARRPRPAERVAAEGEARRVPRDGPGPRAPARARFCEAC